MKFLDPRNQSCPFVNEDVHENIGTEADLNKMYIYLRDKTVNTYCCWNNFENRKKGQLARKDDGATVHPLS